MRVILPKYSNSVNTCKLFCLNTKIVGVISRSVPGRDRHVNTVEVITHFDLRKIAYIKYYFHKHQNLQTRERCDALKTSPSGGLDMRCHWAHFANG